MNSPIAALWICPLIPFRKANRDVTCFFFFSSRRRHTRSKRDWSSDVCSSDLLQGRAVRSDDYLRDPWSSSLPAAAAGCGVIDTLLSAHGIVVNLLPPDAFEEQLGRAGQRWLPQPQEGRAITLLEEAPRLDHLRAIGFDPITFDGADPGAFAWAIFELATRAEDAATQLRCDCQPGIRLIPLGVAVESSSDGLMNAEWRPVTSSVPADA